MQQSLRPARRNLNVVRYYRPEEFGPLEELAMSAGIRVVKAGPYVRSSYLAEESYAKARSNSSK